MTAPLVDRILSTLRSQAAPPAAAPKPAGKGTAAKGIRVLIMKQAVPAGWVLSKRTEVERDARGAMVGTSEFTPPARLLPPTIKLAGMSATVELDRKYAGSPPIWATFGPGMKANGTAAFVNLVDGELRMSPPPGWGEAEKWAITIVPGEACTLEFPPGQ